MIVTNEIESYIVLNEEQRKNLCEELARLVCKLRKDESVECIYFVPYKKVEGVGYCLSITIVRDDSMNPFKDVELREYSDMHEERKLLEKYGVEISTYLASSLEYVMVSEELINASCYDLFNSTIIFDRTGKYFKIIDNLNLKEGLISYYSNLAQIEPPIMDELEELAISDALEATRKFTKTEMFKDIMNM